MTDAGSKDIPAYAFLVISSQVFHLDKTEVSIGRSLDNDLVIQDPTVSRLHAKLVASNGRFLICDQRSTYGTFVNGERVDQRVLTSGDIISLAETTMLYVEDSPGLLNKFLESTSPLVD